MKVYVGVVSHKHGNNLYAGVSQEALNRAVHEYVRENWSCLKDCSTEEEIPENCPDNPDEAILLYFEVMSDQMSGEYLETEALEVEQ